MRHRSDPGGEPGPIAWLVAFLSLVLPWVGGALALAGAYLFARGETGGAVWAALGFALVLLDLAIDLWWAHPATTPSTEPALNARATQLVGRELPVVEPIVHGRGKAKVGDTLWLVEGPDCPAGTRVRVTGARSSVLLVEPVDPAGRS